MRGLLATAMAVLALGGCNETPSPQAQPSSTPSPETGRRIVEVPKPSPAATFAVTTQELLLHAAKGGDGDSWKDTQGREYRLGLINTPELSECYGQAASDRRKQLTGNGFRADTYSMDSYGRLVSVVTLPDGTNLNVLLARTGYANDKYLEEFRHENASLGRELDAAFAAAKREHRGLWGTCRAIAAPAPFVAAPAPAPGNSACHPDYSTCIPVKGDGSGNGAANDLDCGDLKKLVLIRRISTDPYRLDGSDQDGRGCESYA